MPPLSKMLRPAGEALPGFEPADKPPAPFMPDPVTVGANRYIRTSLPPFNSSPDSLRQFNENGKTPTKRVVPLPQQVSQGSITNVSNTTVINSGSSSSSGSGSSSTFKLSAASVVLSVPSLLPGATFVATVVMAKSFQLLQLQASQPVEVRMYGDGATQNADIVRITDAPAPFQVVPGIISDVVFDTPPYAWSWQNRMGANADSPQSSTIYVTVINPSQVTALLASQVTIQYVALES